jgi:RHS repeat-associated protein
VTDPLGNVTAYAYNPAGDLVSLTDPLGHEVSLATDGAGRTIAGTDPRGYTTRIQYDGLDRITQTTDPLGGITRNSFDAAQRPSAVIDALGHAVESYAWDTGDRLTATTDANLNSTTYTYDANKRLATITDRKGQMTRITRDPEGRIVAIDYADGSIQTLAYDAAGRLIQVQDAASTLTYAYDILDRLTKETATTAAGSHSVEYRYDALDSRTRRTVDGTDIASYAYDRAGRLMSIGTRNQSTGYQWDAANRLLKKTLPNGITQGFGYDAASRLTAIAYRRPDNTLIEEIAYAYDAAGNRLSKSTASATVPETPMAASYDAANRMSAVTLLLNTAGAKTYALAYDDNGNLISKANTADAADTTTYTWDARDRLIAIAGPGVIASFQYDALGRRIARTLNGNTTQYLYDGVQAIGELRGAGIDIALLTGLAIDEAIARYTAAGARTYLTDALGSVIAQTKEDASTLNRYGYSSYGETQSSADDEGNSTQYTARENDGTGLYFYRARYYDPVLKRFIAEDPIGLAGGINPYVYVDNAPTMYTDPMGLMGNRSGASVTNQYSGKYCGSGWSFSFVPDSFRGRVSFSASCNSHDVCYAGCGSDWRQCNASLRDDMKDQCDTAYRNGTLALNMLYSCRQQAALYFSAVNAFGRGPWAASQERCRCNK